LFKDDELDRLARERDRCFALLKAARDERKRHGQTCSRLHDDLDAAYKAQQRIFQENQAAWEQLQRVMQDCSQRIRAYHAEADSCHANMTDAFAQSRRSWDSGDRSAAKAWSEAGKRYQSEMRSAKQQAAYWVSQSKDSQDRFKNTGGGMDAAKRRTQQLKADFDAANSRLKTAKAEVERLERQCDEAKRRFQDRLERLKREAPLERQRRIDQEAARSGYRASRAKELAQAQVGRDKWTSSDGQITTKVKAGWSRDHDMPCTDVIIEVRGIKGHHHTVIDEDGRVLIDEWRHG
jgi:chromosome segregation ATPase